MYNQKTLKRVRQGRPKKSNVTELGNNLVLVKLTKKDIRKIQEDELKKNPPIITKDEVVGYSKERQIKGKK